MIAPYLLPTQEMIDCEGDGHDRSGAPAALLCRVQETLKREAFQLVRRVDDENLAAVEDEFRLERIRIGETRQDNKRENDPEMEITILGY